MEAIVERCCGIDVHSAELVVCVLLGPADRKPRKEIRRFPTFSRDLLELRDWLAELGVTHIAMESTGMYWKPVYAVFEGDFEVIVGNAHHIKNVPGRKTDVKDSEWIADLVRHGLIRASFVPPEPIRRLRDLLRYRRKLVQARTAERNRLLNVLEQANIKLACVASDVFGVSGMRMLEAMSHGESDPRKLAALALGRLRAKLDDLRLALDGGLDEHHRFMLDIQLGRLRQLDDDLKRLHTKIEELLLPLQEKRELLTQIPGVGPLAAAIILSEVGTDMSAFPSAHALTAWAGLAPGNHESAGKRLRGTTRKGNRSLLSILVESAQAAARAKGSYFKDKFHRLRTRRGYKRAAVAIARKILIAVFHMLKNNAPFRELGEAYLDAKSKRRTVTHLKQRIERLGFDVTVKAKSLSPTAPPDPAQQALFS
ncbi:MAG: IS110 family transposase [Nannocystaceae bacterium]